MNDVAALTGVTDRLSARSLSSEAGGASSTLFGDQLSALLEQSMLQQALGSSSSGGIDASALLQTALLSSLAQDQGSDNTALMMCMLMMSAGGSGAGSAAALSALASAGSGNTVSTAGLGTVSAAYRSNAASYQTLTGASSTGTGEIPSASWKPANPSLTSNQSSRSAAKYRSVIDQFDVENNERYRVNKQGNNDTYCNIFVWDVTRAMGAEIPHYVDSETQQARSYPDTDGTYAMTANKMADWMKTMGESYGWKRVSAEEAQAYANQGCPAVTVWKNSKGHGHVQVVCPSEDGTYDAKKGVTVAQAGRHLYNYAHISQVYSKNTLDDIAYYVHN